MNISQLASKLTKDNKGKSRMKIGDARETLKLLAIEIKKDPVGVTRLLLSYAEKQKVRKP